MAEFTPLRVTPPIAAASGATRWDIIRFSATVSRTIKKKATAQLGGSLLLTFYYITSDHTLQALALSKNIQTVVS